MRMEKWGDWKDGQVLLTHAMSAHCMRQQNFSIASNKLFWKKICEAREKKSIETRA